MTDLLLAGGAIRIKIVRVVIAVARPVTLRIIFFALALFFPFVASFQIVVIALARPVTLRIIFFALALLITLCISGVRFFHLIRLDDGEPDEVF